MFEAGLELVELELDVELDVEAEGPAMALAPALQTLPSLLHLGGNFSQMRLITGGK